MLQLKDVTFGYDTKPVLYNIDLDVKAGEHISIIGESGCGKSTLLQLIYGLHHHDGRISWNGKELLGPNFNLVPGEPFMKYLAQDFDLMLPLTAAENIGKYLSNMYPRKKQQRIKELLEVVEMTSHANIKASKLSGGQQQRVALARALAKEPEVLLLDEPFSHIDHFRKNNLRRQVYSYLQEHNVTCITATHDSTDALSFANRTIVLQNGKILADEKPEELYNRPPCKYVGSLFGDVNELELQHILPETNKTGTILLYPHDIKIVSQSDLKGKVQKSFFKGKNYEIVAELNGKKIFFNHDRSIPHGTLVSLSISKRVIELRCGQLNAKGKI